MHCGKKGEFHWRIFPTLRNLHFLTEWKNLIILPCFPPVSSFSLFNPLCVACFLPLFVPLCSFFHHSYLLTLPAGDELLGMDGARYLKLDDFKDQDDDFLSPKKSLREFEGGMGTT